MKKTLLTFVAAGIAVAVGGCGSKNADTTRVEQSASGTPSIAAPADQAEPTATADSSREASAENVKQTDDQKKYKAAPGRNFIITDLSVKPPAGINVGEVKLRNPEAIKNFHPPKNSEIIPSLVPNDPDLQTPARSGFRPKFVPKDKTGEQENEAGTQK